MSSRRACASWPAVAVVSLLGVTASAQNGPVFPPSIVITNYDRVLVGEQESLEAGAFVARVGDNTAGWYNPAGLARVERTAIGASASGFETDVLTLEGVSKAGGSFSITQLPSFFGLGLGDEILHSSRWRLGFSVTKPTSWAQDLKGERPGTSGCSIPRTSASRPWSRSFRHVLPPRRRGHWRGADVSE